MQFEGVSLTKQLTLKTLMTQSGVEEKDIEESFISSHGPGGQNVNKVASCVQLIHIPTGFQVKCQKHRSQGLNRYEARCLLLQKINDFNKRLQWQKRQEIEKLKRQNRKKPQSLKERILEAKHKKSEKKKNRSKITLHKIDKFY